MLEECYRATMYGRCPAISREQYEHVQLSMMGCEKDLEMGYPYMSQEKNNILPFLVRHNALSVSDWKILLAECGLNF